MKRLLIYVFYDKDGVVDNYIPYLLNDISKSIDDILIVVNGKINDEGLKAFEGYTKDILIRENKGYDTYAYRDGLIHKYSSLEKYDEVILMNDTVMGPVYPFKEMFDVMDKKEVDFWGITKHYQAEDIPEHIQTYFLAIRKKMFLSQAFKKYWGNLPRINTYNDAVNKHEKRFTSYFHDLGFKYETYVDPETLRDRHPYLLLTYPMELIRDYHCPVFKRRQFFEEYTWTLNITGGRVCKELFDYLKDNTNYPTDYILKNMLRMQNMTTLFYNLNWNYILPKDYVRNDISIKDRIAFLLYITKTNLTEVLLQYIYIYRHRYIFVD